ncbi:MFS transporter [Microbacterium sp. M3]|uniref:MFS transporter n=1 Tax=Microbacterium arthrosphaerae TaxID=792652 RepID=A0ABU4H2U2_9MICO|nr:MULTISPECIES: MFS transporter [Microbacterium]MDW4573643.1 MFS transporter [Microbacterium arthrosphaerae]MDW7607498.1 MFS transporter [Microbacterium sp. M3]
MSRARRTMSDAAGFWVVAAAFTTVTAYATVPTPLYPLYQAADDFPVAVVTFVFAAFAVGVVVSLFLIGHISDWAGRRRMSLIAVLVSAAAAVVFILWNAVPGLLVARFVDGVSVGALSAAATAHLAELRGRARPTETAVVAASVAGAANLGGLALGPLIGGLFAEFAPDPLELPHVVFLVLFVVAALALRHVPETVAAAERAPYRPQRLAFPPASRAAFAAAGTGAAASFALFALFTSLAPTFLHDTFHVSDHLVEGATVFAVFGAAAAAQLLLVRVAQRTQLVVAMACFAAGLPSIAAGAVIPSLALFLAGGIVAGAGAGIMFRSAIAAAGALAAPERRGETLALLFLIAYGGLVAPVLLVGVTLSVVGEVTVLLVFSGIVLAATLGAGVAMRRHLRQAVPRETGRPGGRSDARDQPR